jgi:RNA polymerase sigma factor (sigma-70 family)
MGAISMTYEEAVGLFASWNDDLTRRADAARRAACDVFVTLPDLELCMADAARRTLQAADRRIRDGSPPTSAELRGLAEAMIDEAIRAQLEREGTVGTKAMPGSTTPPDEAARNEAALLRLLDALAEFGRNLGDDPQSGLPSALGDVTNTVLRPGFRPKAMSDSELERYVKVAVERRRIDRWRKKARAAHASLPDSAVGGLWLADHREDPPSTITRKGEEAALLQGALAALSPDDSEVLRLYHFESLGWAEVASRLNIKEGTARMRGHRALEKLRTRPELACLFEETEEPTPDE